MTAGLLRRLASVVVVLAASGCTNFFEIPIETPIQPKLDVSPFQRVLIIGFVAGGTDDVDTNLETVRLLRSQLRTKSDLRVIEADALPLTEVGGAPARREPAEGQAETGAGDRTARAARARSGTRRISRRTSTSSRTSTTGRRSARSTRTR